MPANFRRLKNTYLFYRVTRENKTRHTQRDGRIILTKKTLFNAKFIKLTNSKYLHSTRFSDSTLREKYLTWMHNNLTLII